MASHTNEHGHWTDIGGIRGRTDSGHSEVVRRYEHDETGIYKERRYICKPHVPEKVNGTEEVAYYHPDDPETHETFAAAQESVDAI